MLGTLPKLKLILIPALAGALGFILISDSSKEPESEPVAPNKKNTLVSMRKPAVWPEFELEEIALLQPYKTLKQIEQIQTAEGLAEEQSPTAGAEQVERASDIMQVRAVFQTPQGASALLGDRVVRVGDVLSNGKKIIAIHAHGVEIADQ